MIFFWICHDSCFNVIWVTCPICSRGILLGRVRLGSIQNKNNWNNACKRLFGSYCHFGIPGFPFRNIFLFRNIPSERALSQYPGEQAGFWDIGIGVDCNQFVCVDGGALIWVIRVFSVIEILPSSYICCQLKLSPDTLKAVHAITLSWPIWNSPVSMSY